MSKQNLNYRKIILLILITVSFLRTANNSFADVSAELVDKVLGPDDAPLMFYTGKIKINLANGKSKILPYRTHFDPSVIGDSVYIITTNVRGDVVGIITYNTNNSQINKYSLPPDINTFKKKFFCSPSFSPDGKKLAYYIVYDDGKGKVVVRTFPDYKIIKESPTYTLTGRGVTPLLPIWKTPQSVEFEEEFFDPPLKINFTW
jgi:hypothetical protein